MAQGFSLMFEGQEFKTGGSSGGINFTPGDTMEVSEDNVLDVKLPNKGVLTPEEYDALSDEEKSSIVAIIDDGEDDADESDSSTESGVPSGTIVIWYGYIIPDGWAICDGQNGTPDFRGIFPLGASESHPLGESGGSETVTLTKAQMPSHSHSIPSVQGTGTGSTGYSRYVNSASFEAITTGTSGSSQPHDNMPPYKTVYFIMKL